MKKIKFLPILFLLFTSDLFSQDTLKWNFGFGLNSNITSETKATYTTRIYSPFTYDLRKSDSHYGAEIKLDYFVFKSIYLSSGIAYDNIKYSLDGSSYIQGRKGSLDFKYLNLPLGIGIRLFERLQIEFKPSLSILLDAVETGEKRRFGLPSDPPAYASYAPSYAPKDYSENVTQYSQKYVGDLTLFISYALIKKTNFNIALYSKIIRNFTPVVNYYQSEYPTDKYYLCAGVLICLKK